MDLSWLCYEESSALVYCHCDSSYHFLLHQVFQLVPLNFPNNYNILFSINQGDFPKKYLLLRDWMLFNNSTKLWMYGGLWNLHVRNLSCYETWRANFVSYDCLNANFGNYNWQHANFDGDPYMVTYPYISHIAHHINLTKCKY